MNDIVNVTYIGEVVTSFSKGAPDIGESLLKVSKQDLVWDTVNKFYKVISDVFTPLSQAEVDAIKAGDFLDKSLKAELGELKETLDTKAGKVTPHSNSKSQVKIVSKILKLINKKFDGRATQDDLDEIVLMEALDDHLEALTDTYDQAEAWLEDAARTLEEIQAYDVEADPGWPSVPTQ